MQDLKENWNTIMKTNTNKWARLGSILFMLLPIGHFIISDLSVVILKASYVQWFPNSILKQMETTVIDWGLLGQNNVLYMFSGFSYWLSLSSFMLGLYNYLIFMQLASGHKLRLQSLLLCAFASVILLILSMVCFIYPPIIFSAIAILVFGLAIKKENKIA